jgi:RNA polymerase sigma-70 factor (ECF subfamily)
VHLVGDVSAAEDLVQATFVTAMERAATFDVTRDVEPWLAGILANHARDLKRSARRVATTSDIAARLELDERTPLDSALDAEQSAALAKAVDDLPEPYRAVMLLRLRHGMKDADIAHVLDRSPGAVRVQLHRGREMLRKKLPASLVGAVVLLIEPARGMAAVKASVMTHAAAIQSVSATTAVVGGVIVTKKMILIAASVIVLAALVGWRAFEQDPARGADVVKTDAEKPPGAEESRGELATTASSSTSPRTEASNAKSDVELTKLPGRVIDAATGNGIAGARIELFATRRMSYAELKRAGARSDERIGDFVRTSTWPTVLEELSDLARAGREEIDVYDEPAAGQEPIAIAVTDREGGFELRCSSTIGFLVCRAEGFETRRMAVKPYQEHWKDTGNGRMVPSRVPVTAVTVGMFQPKRFFGHLIDPEGKRVARRVRLLVDGTWTMPADRTPSGISTSPAVGTWEVQTEEDGSFDCMVAAEQVSVRTLEPGLALTRHGIHPERRERWTYVTSWRPGNQTEPALVVLVTKPFPCLVVRDRGSRAPIEVFHLLGRGVPPGMLWWSGLQSAPLGRLALAASVDITRPEMQSGMRSPHEFTVWAEGFAPAKVRVESLLEAADILVELEAGEIPSVRGIVRDGTKGVAGACVTLVPTPDRYFSTEGPRDVADATLTDDRGAFELHGPAGMYALRVARGETVEWRSIVIPDDRDVDIDLCVDTRIVVHLRRSDGGPCPDHVLALRGVDGANTGGKSDQTGTATFSRLAPGKYELFVPYVSTELSFTADEVIPVDLVRGERRDIDVTIPDPRPRFARLVVTGQSTVGRWQAMDRFKEQNWIDVEPDGRIPIDLQVQVHELALRGPDAREWRVHVPKRAPDGYEIRIDPDGPGYEGVLVSLADGKPIPRVRVNAYLKGGVREALVRPTCVTDADGRFVMRGLTAERWYLWFDDGDERRGVRGKLAGLSFTPDELPGATSVVLSIALPRKEASAWEGIEGTTLRGRVRDGAKYRGLNVTLTARSRLSGGELSAVEWASVAADGTFEVKSIAARDYRAVFTDTGVQENVGTFDWAEISPGPVIEREFDLK